MARAPGHGGDPGAEEAIALEPSNGSLHLALADSLRDADRKAEAVAEYRKFLELDQESAMRPVAERFIEILSN